MHELQIHAVIAEQRRRVREVEERYRRHGRPVRHPRLQLQRRKR